jgi:hypothetical protein
MKSKKQIIHLKYSAQKMEIPGQIARPSSGAEKLRVDHSWGEQIVILSNTE